MGSGILRSVGDSKRPLYFLIFSSVVNIILDFLFVKYFHFGVAGAGYATLIAQAISAIMVMYVLMKTEDDYKVVLKEIGFDKEILLKINKNWFTYRFSTKYCFFIKCHCSILY